jgi:hypothetical protein
MWPFFQFNHHPPKSENSLNGKPNQPVCNKKQLNMYLETTWRFLWAVPSERLLFNLQLMEMMRICAHFGSQVAGAGT